MKTTLSPIKQRKMARIRGETVASLRRRYEACAAQSEALARELLANRGRTEEQLIDYLHRGKELHAEGLRLLNAATPLVSGRELEMLEGLKADLLLKAMLVDVFFPEANE